MHFIIMRIKHRSTYYNHNVVFCSVMCGDWRCYWCKLLSMQSVISPGLQAPVVTK